MSRVQGQPQQQPQSQQQDLEPEVEDMVLGDGTPDTTQVGEEPWILADVEDTVDVAQPAQPPQQQQQQQQQPPVRRQGQPPQQSGAGAQHEVRLRTGHVFRGATPEAALQAAQDYLNRQLDDDVGYRDYPQQPVIQQPQQPAWSDEEFYKVFASNPRAAMAVWFEHALGMPVEDFRSTVDKSYSVATQVEDRIAIADFMANNPDYPASNEAGHMLTRRLTRDGVELTAGNLEVAYRQLVREGRLVPVQQQQQQQQPQYEPNYRDQYDQPPQQQQPPRRPQSRGAGAPPPPPDRPQPTNGGGGSQIGDVELSADQFEDLSAQDMKRYMTRRRQLGHPVGGGF